MPSNELTIYERRYDLPSLLTHDNYCPIGVYAMLQITQTDIDAGTVMNVATVTAIDSFMLPLSADVIDKVPLHRTWSVTFGE